MIFERNNKCKTVQFGGIPLGHTFVIDGDRLYLKVSNPDFNINAVDLTNNNLTYVGRDVAVTPVKVKIVEVE